MRKLTLLAFLLFLGNSFSLLAQSQEWEMENLVLIKTNDLWHFETKTGENVKALGEWPEIIGYYTHYIRHTLWKPTEGSDTIDISLNFYRWFLVSNADKEQFIIDGYKTTKPLRITAYADEIVEETEAFVLTGNDVTAIPEEVLQHKKLKYLIINSSGIENIPALISQLTQLQYLHIYNNNITALPPEIGMLKNLVSLDLSNNLLENIPSTIGNLKKLRDLWLYKNEIDALPKELGELANLEFLTLDENQLTALPSTIGNLKALQYLRCSDNPLTEVPKTIGKLQNLSELTLRDNKLTVLPKEIGNLSTLNYLSVSSNELTELPKEWSQLKALETLSVFDNKLTTIPKEYGQLSTLKKLNVFSNEISVFPPAICQLTNLEVLSFGWNQLTSIPNEIKNLKKLKELDLNNNELTALPAGIGEAIKHVSSLNLRENQLKTIPKEIGAAISAWQLKLDANQLKTVPKEIGKLQLLTHLQLNDNQLESIPKEIANLSLLQDLDLKNNQLTTIPFELEKLKALESLDLRANRVPPEYISLLQERLPKCGISYIENPTDLESDLVYARSGHIGSQFRVAKAYDEGTDVAQNLEEAFAWYTKCSAHKLTEREKSWLQYFDENGMVLNSFESEQGFGLSLDRSYMGQAQFNLAMLCFKGLGTKQHTEKGIAYLEMAAKNKNSKAIVAIGPYYQFGLYGVPVDSALAIYWYKKAAELEDEYAIEQLRDFKSFQPAIEITTTDITTYADLSAEQLQVFGVRLGMTINEAYTILSYHPELYVGDIDYNFNKQRIYIYDKDAAGEKDKCILYLIWEEYDTELSYISVFHNMKKYLVGATKEMLSFDFLDKNSNIYKTFLKEPDSSRVTLEIKSIQSVSTTYYYNKKSIQLGMNKSKEDSSSMFGLVLPVDPSTFVDRMFNKAITALSRRDYEKAVGYFDQVLEKETTKFEIYEYKGLALERLDKYQEAVDVYTTLIKKNLNNARAYYLRGKAKDSYTLKDEEGAIEDFGQAIALDPSNLDIYKERAKVYESLRNEEGYKEAIKDYTFLIKRDSSDLDVYKERARVYESLRNEEGYKSAIKDYTFLIERDASDYSNFWSRALVYGFVKEYEKSIQDYNKTIEVYQEGPTQETSSLPFFYAGRGGAKASMGNYEAALVDYYKALELEGSNDYLYDIAGVKLGSGDYKGALEDYTTVIKEKYADKKITFSYDQSQCSDAYINRGRTYVLLEEYEKAIEDYTAGIECSPEWLLLYYRRAEAKVKLKKYEAAREELTALLEKNKNYYWVYLLRGQIYLEEGKYQLALESISKVIAINTVAASPYRWRAKAYLGLNKKAEACKDLKLAIEKGDKEAEDLLKKHCN